MAITYGDFRDRVLHTLGAEEKTTYSDALIFEACTNALNAIMTWVPNPQLATISMLAGKRNAVLPANCWRIEGVQDEGGLLLPRFELRPNIVRRPMGDTGYAKLADWMEYPRGTLLMSSAVDSARSLTIFYLALWEKPADSEDMEFELPTPESAIAGMIYYASAHCLTPGSVNSAQIRQFNTKVDSGSPVDNSLEMEAKFLRQLFVEEMKLQPKFIGATL